ncbi:MAG: ribbon-helix-helix protein, CopG family [Clostridia bacterium]|nr:ribbon-helix-helix protein, CopG family [Clostridia bacterium]
MAEDFKNEKLKIRKRGEDYNRLISVRIKEDTLSELDRIAAETNYSRNELINIILSHGVKNLIIE